MPKEHECVVDIPRIYKNNFVDMCMFSFVNGVIATLPTVTVEKALELFQKHYNLTEDNYSIDSAKVKYSKMKYEFTKLA